MCVHSFHPAKCQPHGKPSINVAGKIRKYQIKKKKKKSCLGHGVSSLEQNTMTMAFHHLCNSLLLESQCLKSFIDFPDAATMSFLRPGSSLESKPQDQSPDCSLAVVGLSRPLSSSQCHPLLHSCNTGPLCSQLLCMPTHHTFEYAEPQLGTTLPFNFFF